MVVDFDNPIAWMDVEFSWLNYDEKYNLELYNNGVLVGTFSDYGLTDQVDPTIRFTADGGASFDKAVFSAPNIEDDYLIHSISFEQVTPPNATELLVSDDSEVKLDIVSSLNDTDGSETLSVILGGIPKGFSITDGTNNFTASLDTDSFNITTWDLANIKLIVPKNVQGDVSLTVTSTCNRKFK